MVQRKLNSDPMPKPATSRPSIVSTGTAAPRPSVGSTSGSSFYPTFEEQLRDLMQHSMSLGGSPAEMSKQFILADMDGRAPKDNRICRSCCTKLSFSEVNWTYSKDDPCMLCQISEIKPEAYTKPFTDFLQENPTVFHTVDYFEKKLGKLGYKKVSRHRAPATRERCFDLIAC
jgi:hypothetical protein